jgi:hypothetical protein
LGTILQKRKVFLTLFVSVATIAPVLPFTISVLVAVISIPATSIPISSLPEDTALRISSLSLNIVCFITLHPPALDELCELRV